MYPWKETCKVIIQVVDKGKEVHEEIVVKGLLKKDVVMYLTMLW